MKTAVILQTPASIGKAMHMSSLTAQWDNLCATICKTVAPVTVCTTKHLKKESILIKITWH